MLLKIYVVGGDTKEIDAPEPLTRDGLYDCVARTQRLPRDRLKLVSGGQSLQNEQHVVNLRPGDLVMAVTVPTPPPPSVRAVNAAAASTGSTRRRWGAPVDPGPPDGDDDVDIRLPAAAPTWQHAVLRGWRHYTPLPDWPVHAFFWVGPRFWLGLAAWCVGSRLAAAHDLGPLYILGSLFAAMALNLGRRAPGAPSAYSIFNGLRRLPGQLDVDDLDRQIRRGGQM